ncbi:unnamed protein product [Tuber melanosporum]|uniref:(Perigord truffle) hypothetical protein n=1 Tax=Tuber melanosporum (strain Mel28) TaxID=656061 RepID=D5G9Q0_TUBMM|nr:uncharacterized protein GSTUM_00005015001 [Tuber melanosporum]CAZ81243.1 unnamed protein product [Tuber melanosporum]
MVKPWGKHKKILHELYISKKKKLEQVMEIMEKERGFVACRRAYMKTFRKWGYQKNRKSRTASRESGSSRKINTRLRSTVEPPCEPPEVALEARVNTHEANPYNPTPTHKINETGYNSPGRGATTGGLASPLDKFKDSDDLNKYIKLLEGVLLLNEIKKKALLSGNPDPHSPVMSDYQQVLERVLSGDPPIA